MFPVTFFWQLYKYVYFDKGKYRNHVAFLVNIFRYSWTNWTLYCTAEDYIYYYMYIRIYMVLYYEINI